MRSVRKAAVGGLVASGAVLGSVALSFACTATAGLSPLTVQAGPVGTSVALTGTTVRPGEVSVRWDGVKGPVLARALTNDTNAFSTRITVPSAVPGVHVLVLTQDDAAVARATFEVIDEAGSAPQLSPRASQPDRELPIGLAAGSAGVAAVAAGFGVAAVRRRRVTA